MKLIYFLTASIIASAFFVPAVIGFPGIYTDGIVTNAEEKSSRNLLLASIEFGGSTRPKSQENIIWFTKSKFDHTYGFSDGRAYVKDDNVFGYIDKDGRIVMEPQYAWTGSYSEDLKRVQPVKGGKFGYIDKDGKMVIEPVFDEVSDFSEGLAAVIKDKARFYIDKEGKTAFKADYQMVYSFSEGMAVIKDKSFFSGEKFGFINRDGKIAIKPQYDFAWDFSDGLAPVRKGDYFNGTWGYIDKEGKTVIDFKFRSANCFYEGIACVKTTDEKYGYIDKTGKFIIEARFEKGYDFSEGLAAVKINGKWGYIDTTGRIVIQPQFDGVDNFSEGLAIIHENGAEGLYGFIDKEGNVVIEPQFVYAMKFTEGIAAVKQTMSWGFLKNPLIPKKQEETFEQGGQLIGEIKSVNGREIIVGGRNIGERVFMGDKLSIYSGDKLIILRSSFPMQTVTKCVMVSGSLNDIKPGMKVYRYRKVKRTE